MNPLMKNRHAARGEKGGDSVSSGAEGKLEVMTDCMPIYHNEYTHDTPIFGCMYSRAHFLLVKHNIYILLHACWATVRLLHPWAVYT